MKSRFLCRGVGALLGMMAVAATAQEQWLEYHTATEPRGYHWVELSTNAPPNVAMPKELRPYALYGEWKNGLDGGRKFVIDRASRNGICDRIYFDVNGNGRLDDDPVIEGGRRGYNDNSFPPIKVVFKGEDGPISYHLIVRFYQFDEGRAQLLAGSGCWYEGQVDVGGKKRQVQLFDSNINGTFNDQGLEASDCDRVVVQAEKGKDKQKTITRYLGRYLEVDGQLYRFEVARDGAFVKVQKADGVELGQVRVPDTITEFEAIGECGHFLRRPVKGALTLPIGKYRIQRWSIDRKDDKNVMWTLSGSRFSSLANFDVTSAEAVKLEVGEPIRPVVEATETRGQVRFGLQMQGTLGETVDLEKGGTRPRAPLLQVAGLVGDFRSTNSFEYG